MMLPDFIRWTVHAALSVGALVSAGMGICAINAISYSTLYRFEEWAIKGWHKDTPYEYAARIIFYIVMSIFHLNVVVSAFLGS